MFKERTLGLCLCLVGLVSLPVITVTSELESSRTTAMATTALTSTTTTSTTTTATLTNTTTKTSTVTNKTATSTETTTTTSESYTEVLKELNIMRLSERRELICLKFAKNNLRLDNFKQLSLSPRHKMIMI